MTLSELTIMLGIDKKKLDQGLLQAQGQVHSFTNSIKTFIAPLAGALSFGALFGSWSAEADRLGKFADMIGESITTVDAWGQAAKLAGGSAEGFQSSIQSLNRGLADMATFGTGRAKAALDALGISATDSRGKAKKASDVLLEMAGVAERMDKTKFVGLAQKAGLDQGTIMLLQKGRQGVEELVKSREGLAYTQEDAANAKAFNESIANLKKAVMSAASILFNAIGPALAFVAEKLTKGAAFLRQHKPFVLAFFAGLATVITAKLIPAFAKMALTMLANPLTWIIGALTIVALLFADLYAYLDGGKSRFNWGPIVNFFKEFKPLIIQVATLLGVFWAYLAGKKVVAAVKNSADIIKKFKDFATSVSRAFGKAGNALKAFGRLAPIVFGKIATAFQAFSRVFMTNPFLLLTAGIVALIVALDKLVNSHFKAEVTMDENGAQQRTLQSIDPVTGEPTSEKIRTTGFFSDPSAGVKDYYNAQEIAKVPAGAHQASGGNTISNETHINEVKVVTQATDAPGIAKEIPKATENAFAQRAARNAAAMEGA
jgi:hypothetical protein